MPCAARANRDAAQELGRQRAMMRFFAKFLRKNFDVCEERLSVTCNLLADHLEKQSEIEDFWLDALDLARTYGTCRLTLSDSRIAQMLYGSIQELPDFTRESRLDLPA